MCIWLFHASSTNYGGGVKKDKIRIKPTTLQAATSKKMVPKKRTSHFGRGPVGIIVFTILFIFLCCCCLHLHGFGTVKPWRFGAELFDSGPVDAV